MSSSFFVQQTSYFFTQTSYFLTQTSYFLTQTSYFLTQTSYFLTQTLYFFTQQIMQCCVKNYAFQLFLRNTAYCGVVLRRIAILLRLPPIFEKTKKLSSTYNGLTRSLDEFRKIEFIDTQKNRKNYFKSAEIRQKTWNSIIYIRIQKRFAKKSKLNELW